MDLLTTYTPTTWHYKRLQRYRRFTHFRAHAFSSQFAFTSRCLVTALNNGNSSASLLPVQKSTELIAPNLLVITSLHEPHRQHSSSIFAFVSVAAGTYLPSCFSRNGLRNPGCCPSNGRCFATVTQQRAYTLLYVSRWRRLNKLSFKQTKNFQSNLPYVRIKLVDVLHIL
jgi:hypothetical protein